MLKKKYALLLSVLVLIAAIITAWFLMFRFLPESHQKQAYRIENFEKYSEDFAAILALVQTFYPNSGNLEHDRILLDYAKDYSCIWLSDEYGIVELTSKEHQSLKTIANAFRNQTGSMTVIDVDPGRVTFLSEWRTYSIVYTYDDKAPAFLCQDGEAAKISVEKIKPHWYHVFDMS